MLENPPNSRLKILRSPGGDRDEILVKRFLGSPLEPSPARGTQSTRTTSTPRRGCIPRPQIAGQACRRLKRDQEFRTPKPPWESMGIRAMKATKILLGMGSGGLQGTCRLEQLTKVTESATLHMPPQVTLMQSKMIGISSKSWNG